MPKSYTIPFRFLFDNDQVIGSTATYVRNHLVNADNFCSSRSRLDMANRICELFGVVGASVFAEHERANAEGPDAVKAFVDRMKAGPVGSVELTADDYEALMKVIRALESGNGNTVYSLAPEWQPRPPMARFFVVVNDDFTSAAEPSA